MKTLLSAILGGLLSLSAPSAFAIDCEKQISPIGLDIPYHSELTASDSNAVEILLQNYPADYANGLQVRLDRFRNSIKKYIWGYRTVGGELYWQRQKLRGKYARQVNPNYFRERSAFLGRMGNHMRSFLKLRKSGVLTAEIAESIEDAVADYGNLEIHEPQPEGEIKIPTSAGSL